MARPQMQGRSRRKKTRSPGRMTSTGPPSRRHRPTPSVTKLVWAGFPVWSSGLRPQEHLDRVALVHRAVGGGCLAERQEVDSVHCDAVSDAYEADVAAGACGVDGLHHRLLGADGLDHGVRAEPVRELLDRSDAGVAA